MSVDAPATQHPEITKRVRRPGDKILAFLTSAALVLVLSDASALSRIESSTSSRASA